MALDDFLFQSFCSHQNEANISNECLDLPSWTSVCTPCKSTPPPPSGRRRVTNGQKYVPDHPMPTPLVIATLENGVGFTLTKKKKALVKVFLPLRRMQFQRFAPRQPFQSKIGFFLRAGVGLFLSLPIPLSHFSLSFLTLPSSSFSSPHTHTHLYHGAPARSANPYHGPRRKQ